MMALRVVIFVVVLVLGLGATTYYVHRRASALLRLDKRWRRVLAGVLIVALGAMLLARTAALEALGVVASTIELAILISAVFMLALDVPRLLVWGARRIVERAKGREPIPSAPDPPEPERREFLKHAATATALGIGGTSAVYGSLFGRHDYHVEEVPVRIAGLAPALDGLTIVQLSDVHLGVYVGEREILRAIELIKRARPDVVALTGDLLDHDPSYASRLGELVRRLSEDARPRFGVFSIPGNHDYYAGIERVQATVRRAGARTLVNAGRAIGDGGGAFALLGVDDLWATRSGDGPGPDLARAIAMVPRELPRVLLCHNPAFFADASHHVALQLSGHTHGGQVNVMVRPADLFLPGGWVAGLYERDGARLYVNRGFGTAGPPARVGAPPEVTRIVLVAA